LKTGRKDSKPSDRPATPPAGDSAASWPPPEGLSAETKLFSDPNVQLMLQFQQSGDQNSFASLVDRNQSKVYSIIYRFVLDRAEAEDLTQEVFLRVYRTAARYTPTAKFSTWLYRIAVNVSLNALRSRARTKTMSLALPQDTENEEYPRAVEDPKGDKPNQGLEDDELKVRIGEAIETLPENQRIAIVLNKFEGLSYEEIAKILNLSMMAVKSLLSRARSNLKDSLDPYLEGN
jgi:RNA polymerase sigma-70 factor (ECF subfamily)